MTNDKVAEEIAIKIMYHFNCATLTKTQVEVIVLEALSKQRQEMEKKLKLIADLIHDDVPHKYQTRLLEVLNGK